MEWNNTEIAFKHLSNLELKRAYILFSTMSSPALTGLGTWLVSLALKLRIPVRGLIKMTLFKQFCGGESIEECLKVMNLLAKHQVGAVLDYAVEAKDDEKDFDKTCQAIKETISHAKDNILPFAVFKMTGIARFALLEKVSEKGILSEQEQLEWQRVSERVNSIVKHAKESKVKILIDAEESWIQAAIDQVVEDLMQKYNRDDALVFHTIQLYRTDRLPYLKALLEQAKAQNYVIGAKLVRGAYMEKERMRAEKHDYPSPIHVNKEATDKDFNAALYLYEEYPKYFAIFAGTHNEKSTDLLTKIAQNTEMGKGRPIVFSQLYGMSDHLSFNLAAHGFPVSKYLPFGPVKEAIPYLFRRAAENTSVGGQVSRELKLIRAEMKRRKLS
ncbi:MAG: proline dehydrogenase family protein [Oligoflexales bacterium]|nr:proline dehydrogenase family protein [Oligoflexales bacterium]